MIRINLLGVAPPPGAKAPGPPTTTARMAVIFGIALLVSFLVVAIFYRIWSTAVNQQKDALKKEQDREAELKTVAAKNQRYQADILELERRTKIMDTLQNSRTGPVDLMSGLGATVNRTNDLYLITVAPSGNRLVVRGQSNSVESIAVFIAALKKQFGPDSDVQLRQYYQDDQGQRLSFKFNIDFTYQQQPPPPAQTPAPAARPAPAPAAPGRRAGT